MYNVVVITSIIQLSQNNLLKMSTGHTQNTYLVRISKNYMIDNEYLDDYQLEGSVSKEEPK